MARYDAKENASRVHFGLKSLLDGRAIDFPDTQAVPIPVLVVVFDGEPSSFSGGRILLFQQFFLDRLGIIPEIVRQEPGCIKVFFSISREDFDVFKVTLKTAEFKVLCRDLNITQVQLGGTMFVRPTGAP